MNVDYLQILADHQNITNCFRPHLLASVSDNSKPGLPTLKKMCSIDIREYKGMGPVRRKVISLNLAKSMVNIALYCGKMAMKWKPLFSPVPGKRGRREPRMESEIYYLSFILMPSSFLPKSAKYNAKRKEESPKI